MIFIAKAPGKIIITGEHFVVHGSYALAAAIDRGAIARASLSDRTLIFSKTLGLNAELPDKVPYRLTSLAEALKATLNYLDESRGLKIEIETNLPVSAGLGSSAAGAVALVTAASSALGHTLKAKEIMKLAMVSEKIIHGDPSGIDPAIATYGGVMLFKKGCPQKPVQLKVPIEFIIGYSGAGYSTYKMIRKFAQYKNSNPSTFRALVDSSSIMGKTAASALITGDLKLLASIINFNHTVLTALGVSSNKLNNLVENALNAGCIGAKLTGGGGGGCIIALPKSREQSGVLEKIAIEAKESWKVKIPMKGVKVWQEK
ncbi:mevalonate kinase [Thermoproteota archaeon]